ncbi:MAG: helix-turn-helix transcriptional regulator [Bacilli bacterium]|nr:helix-turn-helix transcriptional regulator [Bacilli bacterium]
MITNKDLLNEYLIFSENVKYLRKKKNLTQEELAEICDLSTSYVKQIESCKDYKNITLTTMLKLSKALNTSINDLFYQRH